MIIEIQIVRDKVFKRKGADLYIEREITLFEAFAGFKFELTHLDGRQVLISSPPNKIIGNNETMCVEELGMPFFKRNFKYGNLFIIFTVNFPEKLSKNQRKIIKSALHNENSEKRWDPAIKAEFPTKIFEGTENDLLKKLRKRSRDLEEDDYEIYEEGEEPMETDEPHGIECGNQ